MGATSENPTKPGGRAAEITIDDLIADIGQDDYVILELSPTERDALICALSGAVSRQLPGEEHLPEMRKLLRKVIADDA